MGGTTVWGVTLGRFRHGGSLPPTFYHGAEGESNSGSPRYMLNSDRKVFRKTKLFSLSLKILLARTGNLHA